MALVDTLSDTELADFARKGDRAVKKYLYDKYACLVFNTLHKMNHQGRVTKEELQEGYYNFWNAVISYDPNRDSSLANAIVVFVHNGMCQIYARRTTLKRTPTSPILSFNQPVYFDHDGEPIGLCKRGQRTYHDQCNQYGSVERTLSIQLLYSLINHTSFGRAEKQYLTLYLERNTPAEIAGMCSTTQENVRVTIYNIKEKLKRTLKNQTEAYEKC